MATFLPSDSQLLEIFTSQKENVVKRRNGQTTYSCNSKRIAEDAIGEMLAPDRAR